MNWTWAQRLIGGALVAIEIGVAVALPLVWATRNGIVVWN